MCIAGGIAALAILALACPRAGADDGGLVHWDFEAGLQVARPPSEAATAAEGLAGWEVVSGNLAPQPTNASNDRWGGNFGKQGDWFIGTCELPDGDYDDALTGELRSPTFVIGSRFIRLLVGGGGHRDQTYVALIRASDGAELKRSWGRNNEVMVPVLWEVAEHRGTPVYIQIVDRATGGWGHINVDDIREVGPEEEAEVARQEAEAAKARAERIRKFEVSLTAPRSTGSLRLRSEPALSKAKGQAGQASRRKVYSGDSLTDIAMPLGGIGAGSIAIGGRGDLREWQIFNTCNPACVVPGGFFGVRVDDGEGQPVGRVLQMDAMPYLPPVEGVKFVGEYPIAELRYEDHALPVEVSLEAFSPFAPMNEKDSALPAIVFNFTVRNPLEREVEVALLAACQNAVGYDGRGAITGQPFEVVHFGGYGGNVNTITGGRGSLGVNMTAPEMDAAAKQFGSMALVTTAPGAGARAAWANPNELWSSFVAQSGFAAEGRSDPTPGGSSVNCAVSAPMTLKPGEAKTVAFVLAWHFPNHYADYQKELAEYRIGNMYNNWFGGALEAAEYVVANLERLTRETRLFRDTFYDSTLPYWFLDCVSSQVSTLRSQTVMWIEDGTFAAFEGSCCCPMNCTHVWNYEQTLAKLFPALERNMRDTDFGVQQDPSGFIHHRTVLPLSLPRSSGAFVDGHLGCIMKMYREYLQSADETWLKHKWPHVRLAMDWAMDACDPDGDGVIDGEQWNTYDCAVYGPNTFVGTWWLGALRAAEEMAKVCGDADAARRYRGRFEKGRAAMDQELWNGEYYIQKYDERKYTRTQYGAGCMADQVVGQWFAEVMDLGYLLPEEHVRTALRSIMKHNFVWDFSDFVHSQRVFAWGPDMGLLVCIWPRGGRPADPILYCDEVWTGIEYQVASHMIYEGMGEQACQIVKAARNRYDGAARPPFKRNPWNEIECGDHYARAMSSWALLLAAEGYWYDGPQGVLRFDPRMTPKNFRAFFSTAAAYGIFAQRRSDTKQAQRNTLEVKAGSVRLNRLELGIPADWKTPQVTVKAGRREIAADAARAGKLLHIDFRQPLTLAAGEKLAVRIEE